MKKFLVLLYFLFLTPYFSFPQTVKCYPTNWWVGMKNPKLQLMVHGNKIANDLPMIKMDTMGLKLATGVHLTGIKRVENPNYLFLDLVIDPSAKPCKFTLPFLKTTDFQYELKPRRPGNGSSYAQGVTSKDFI